MRAEHNPGKVITAVEVGPSHMPQFVYVLSIQDIRDVAGYVVDKVADIPLSGGDVGRGGVLFRQYCASCHRTAVRGGALAFAGTNAPALGDKSAALIAGAIRWGPGAMPSFPPSVMDDRELASVVEYIRQVQHPPHPGGFTLNWFGPVPEGLTAWVILSGLVLVVIFIEKGGRG